MAYVANQLSTKLRSEVKSILCRSLTLLLSNARIIKTIYNKIIYSFSLYITTARLKIVMAQLKQEKQCSQKLLVHSCKHL